MSHGIDVRSNVVIGLTGPVGSGCSTMATLLEKEGYRIYKVSDLIKKDMQDSGISIPEDAKRRSGFQDYGNLKRGIKLDYWVERLCECMQKDGVTGEKVAVDGIRNPAEIKALRIRFPEFYLIAVCSEMDQRWKRISKKYNGDMQSFTRDDLRDKGEGVLYGQNVQGCVECADYVFANKATHYIKVKGSDAPNPTLVEKCFKSKIDDFLPLMEKNHAKNRSPTSQEVQMAAAYALADASRCLKRHVGAIITTIDGGRELPISMGYNENPSLPSHRHLKTG